MPEIPIRAKTGVRVETAPLLVEWDAAIRRPLPSDARTPLDWFVMLEAISRTGVSCADRRSVPVKDLADAMAASRNIVDEGRIWTLYGDLWRALDLGGQSPRGTGGLLRLYRQARMATFLRYRAGFVEQLEIIPFTAEAAVHGYVRVVMEWVRHWPGLSVAHADERREAYDATPPELRSGRRRDSNHWGLGIALPLIVDQDLRELLRVATVEASDISSTQESLLAEDVGAGIIMAQMEHAASLIVNDPTVSSLTAGNVARVAANEALGGALLRTRIRSQDAAVLRDRVLDEVRRYMLQQRSTTVEKGALSPLLAELENEFAAIRVALRAFGGHGD